MTDAPRPHILSTDARLAVLEAGMAQQREEMRADRNQRDREHRENRELLRTIVNDVHDVSIRMTTVADAQKQTNAQVAAIAVRVTDLEDWREGLRSEIRGALRFPKMLLAAWPVVVFAVGAAAWVIGQGAK